MNSKVFLRIFAERKRKIIKFAIMTKQENKLVHEFWEQFLASRDSTQIKQDDWVTVNKASKNSSMTRHTINRLASDTLIRKNDEGRVAMPDVLMIDKLLDYFESAKRVELIKETDITGNKKYLLVDFHQGNSFKSIPQYQIELLVDMLSSFKNTYPGFDK